MPSFHLDTDSYKHKELTMNVFRIATAISYLFYLSHLLYAEKLTSEYQKSNNQNQSHCANLQLYQVTVAYTTHLARQSLIIHLQNSPPINSHSIKIIKKSRHCPNYLFQVHHIIGSQVGTCYG